MNAGRRVGLAGAILVGLLALERLRREAAPEGATSSPEHGSAASSELGLNAPEFSFGVWWDFGERARSFEFGRVELDPHTGRSLSSRTQYAVDFDIEAVACRPNGEVFVGGSDSSGQTILERFRFPSCPGGYVTDMPTYAPEPGVGQPDVLALRASIFGAEFARPSERDCAAAERERIYAGGELAGLSGLVAEPEGRFVLAVAGGALYRVLSRPGAAAEALDLGLESEGPVRLRGAGGVAWHASEGKVYTFLLEGRDEQLVLRDRDNDARLEAGSLEPVSSLDEPATPFEAGIVHRYESTF